MTAAIFLMTSLKRTQSYFSLLPQQNQVRLIRALVIDEIFAGRKHLHLIALLSNLLFIIYQNLIKYNLIWILSFN